MPDPQAALNRVLETGALDPRQLTYFLTFAERPAEVAPWPDWIRPDVRAAIEGRGIERLYRHQREAADHVHGGAHVVLSTGTASGKSLGYLLPGLNRIAEGASDRTGCTMLYLAPTKALAHDQWTAVQELAVPGIRAAVLDGDTPADERRWIRTHANVIFTNPDMLHHSVLPSHRLWSRFLKHLGIVVVDESHIYRGVFGAHVAAVLRRLRRLCAPGEPLFIACSATAANPGEHMQRLIGVEPVVIDHDGSPRGERMIAFWAPDTSDEARSPLVETAQFIAALVANGSQTLAFVRSRRAAEAVAATAQLSVDSELAPSIAAYRGGYLPEERRALEAQFRTGDLRALATTNALELGIDISGLDAVVVTGWPGTRAALWQQMGRAGRAGQPALGIFIARDDPLDTYVVQHAPDVMGAPLEASVFDPENPFVLDPHLAAAAAEAPLTDEEAAVWFGPSAPQRLAELGARGLLRLRPSGWYWTSRDRASDLADLRGTGGAPVTIVEHSTGRLLGTVDAGASHATVHEGAIYVHQGASFHVRALDLDAAVAFVEPIEVDYTTNARSITDITVLDAQSSTHAPGGRITFGTVLVETQVVSYQRRRILTGELLGEHPLDLPVRTLTTSAVWWEVPDAPPLDDPAGAAHAAEHASIGLLPLFATCDRWDIGGVSTALHRDTGHLTVFVYDGYPGGAGFAAHGFSIAHQWLAATRATIRDCACATGCPSCIQSPKCGNGNEPLDKAGAVSLLDHLLGHS